MMFHSSRFPDLIRMALHSVCDARHRSPYAREHHCLTAVRANRHEKQQPEIQQQHKKSTEYKWPLIIRSSAAIQAILEIAFSSSTPLRRLTITRTELPSVEEQSKKKSIARSATRDFNSDNFFSAASSSFFFSLSVPLLYNCQIVAFVCIPQILRYSGGCCRPTFSGILLHSQTN